MGNLDVDSWRGQSGALCGVSRTLALYWEDYDRHLAMTQLAAVGLAAAVLMAVFGHTLWVPWTPSLLWDNEPHLRDE